MMSVPTVNPSLAKLPVKASIGANTSPQDGLSTSTFNLSRRAYWLLSLAIVAGYVLLWTVNFHYVYGWIMDDRLAYQKAVQTVLDWQAPFKAPDGRNALHTYFYLISYLPVMLNISLPSYPLPEFGDKTGHFRFFLYYCVLVHAVLLIIWTWFLTKLTDNRVAAIIALLLFATSPTLTFWTPQPDSRLFGMPFAIPAGWLLLQVQFSPEKPFWSLARRLWVAGSLFGLAQSTHYTALYFIMPFCVSFWAFRLINSWRRRCYWLGLVLFVVGLAWLHVVYELISFYVVGQPWEKGPTMFLINSRMKEHVSPFSLLGNLELWRDWFMGQMGPLLLLAIAAGWGLYVVHASRSRASEQVNRLIVGCTVPLGLAYLGLSGGMPLFRQTSVLQPFLFLFAAEAVTTVAQYLGRVRVVTLGATVCLVAMIGAAQWQQAWQVFNGHQGLGRALEWIDKHKGHRQIVWLNVAFSVDERAIWRLEELEHADPDAWLVSYFPWQWVEERPSLMPALIDARPVASWPTLFATTSGRAEMKAFWGTDYRYNPLMSDVRVTKVSSILRQLRGVPLHVQSVTADTLASPRHEPVNVFDHDASPDGVSSWVSADTPGPHHLSISFEKPVSLDSVRVVLPPSDRIPNSGRPASRIAELDVLVLTDNGSYRTVWSGKDLDKYTVIAADWPAVTTRALKLVVHRQVLPWKEVNQATIEEIVFPGYQVVAPKPRRTFPELTLNRLLPTDKGIVVEGTNITAKTVLVLGGTHLATRYVEMEISGVHSTWLAPYGQQAQTTTTSSGHLIALVPSSTRVLSGRVEAYLTDGFRRSNTVWFTISPPILTRLHPASTRAGIPFNVQADGNAALSIDCEDAGPGTVVMFDSTPLVTAFGNERWLTATVPRELIGKPGRHAVWLKNVFGESDRLEFAVTE